MNRRRPFLLAASIAAVVLMSRPIALAGKDTTAEEGNAGGSYTITLGPAGPYFFGESVYATTNVPASSRPVHLDEVLPERCARRHLRPRCIPRRLVLRLAVQPRT